MRKNPFKNSDEYIADLLTGYPGKEEGVEFFSSNPNWNVKKGDCSEDRRRKIIERFFIWKRIGRVWDASRGRFEPTKEKTSRLLIPNLAKSLKADLENTIGDAPIDLIFAYYPSISPIPSEYKQVILGDLPAGSLFINGGDENWWTPNLFRVIKLTTKAKKGVKAVENPRLPDGVVFCIIADEFRHANEPPYCFRAFSKDLVVVVKKK